DLLTTIPNLEELKLIEIHTSDDNPWDWPQFFKHVQSLSLPLRQLHYSAVSPTLTDDELEETVFGICPNATKRTLLCDHLHPRIVHGLIDQPTFLTTLEVLLPYTQLDFVTIDSHYTARSLHQLLCECSRLRYLETLKMPYMTNFMDIHHRIDMYYSPSSVGEAISPSANIPGIWVCRGLKELRLDLQFHGMGS
ncbi:hypothetical protein BGX23_002091, partial [Mortierella sp. AD031]